MFKHLGAIVSRFWPVFLLAWVAMVVGLPLVSPRWNDITLDGDFAYLPERMTSVRGERLLEKAFPEKLSKSDVVIVFARPDGELTDVDYKQVDRLIEEYTPKNDDKLIVNVFSYQTEVFGRKLISRVGPKGQATLIFLQLRNEFMAVDNMNFLRSLYRRLEQLRSAPDFPKGLDVQASGSAAIGADMLIASEESIQNTEKTTVVLVAIILLLVYRAPGLVVVPLVTIAASVAVAKCLVGALAMLSMKTHWFVFNIFKTTEIFVIVVLFGAGTDFCLFLISRYREELKHGTEPKEAIQRALSLVGGAVSASAFTAIIGLGTMWFSDFGKFRDGGPAIGMCLAVALLASVTLAPAILRALGMLVFWPFHVRVNPQADQPLEEASDASTPRGIWNWIASVILAHPGLILIASIVLLTPLAFRGSSVNLSFDLVNELRESRESVQGLKVLQNYFPPGEIGPVTVLAYRSDGRFSGSGGQSEIARLTKYLYYLPYTDNSEAKTRPIQSVRSLTEPLGSPPGTFNPFTSAGRDKIAVLKNPRAKAAYLSQTGPLAGCVTRFDLVTQHDAFSRQSVHLFNYIEQQLRALCENKLLFELGKRLTPHDPRDLATVISTFPAQQQAELAALPDQLTQGNPKQLMALAELATVWNGAEIDFLGTTAGIRDLEAVTSSDDRLIQILVVLAVAGVLVVILQHPVICVYLILSVVFSYLVTMGVTELFFSWLYAGTFRGLDWKIPTFLFVLLVAIGQDYNIYLATRVLEEQQHRGVIQGLRYALVRTGGIITSCGVIMSGTFVSMITGTLRGIQELGFALSFGIMLDTLVVRTILVPAFLVIWQTKLEPRLSALFKRSPIEAETFLPSPAPAGEGPGVRGAQTQTTREPVR